MGPGTEPIHFVREEVKRDAGPRPESLDGREEEARRAELRRPEEERDPAGSENARELAEERPPFLRLKVLHHAEVPESGHGGALERQPEEVALEEPVEDRD